MKIVDIYQWGKKTFQKYNIEKQYFKSTRVTTDDQTKQIWKNILELRGSVSCLVYWQLCTVQSYSFYSIWKTDSFTNKGTSNYIIKSHIAETIKSFDVYVEYLQTHKYTNRHKSIHMFWTGQKADSVKTVDIHQWQNSITLYYKSFNYILYIYIYIYIYISLIFLSWQPKMSLQQH